jgi:hypothetical protein
MNPNAISLPEYIWRRGQHVYFCRKIETTTMHGCLDRKDGRTHGHTRNKPTQRRRAKDATHMPSPPLRHEVVYELAEAVEEEVLDHHLQDENLRALGAEGVAVERNIVSTPFHHACIEPDQSDLAIPVMRW